MLIDRFMPDFDVFERHEKEVAATTAHTYETALSLDLGRSLPIRVLFAIRSIPAYLMGKRKPQRSFTIADLADAGFVILGEEPGTESVIGVVGRFWRPTGDIRPIDPAEFTEFDLPGMAKATMNLRVDPRGDFTLLSTETRVVGTDERARRLFSLYWKAIGPFSGLIRHLMLAQIKHEAEGSARVEIA